MTAYTPSDAAVAAVAAWMTYPEDAARSVARAALVDAYAIDMPAERDRIAVAIEAEPGQHLAAHPDDECVRCNVLLDAARIARSEPTDA